MSLDANVERVAGALAAHRVNYHHRNVGPEPVTADSLRYTSCEGCDWLGGHRDEAGWEAHLAQALLAPGGVVAEIETDALGRGYIEGWRKGAAEVGARVTNALDEMATWCGPYGHQGVAAFIDRRDAHLRVALMPQNATESPAEPRTHHDAATDTTDDPTRRQEASE